MTDRASAREKAGSQPTPGVASDGGTGEDGGNEIDILEVRERVADVVETLLDQPLDGITTVEAADDGGWRAAFEVVERRAVPDTQDVIGRYEVFLSPTGDVKEYSLQQRFKRSELQDETL